MIKNGMGFVQQSGSQFRELESPYYTLMIVYKISYLSTWYFLASCSLCFENMEFMCLDNKMSELKKHFHVEYHFPNMDHA